MKIKIENILSGNWKEAIRSEVRRQIDVLKAENDAKFEEAYRMLDSLFINEAHKEAGDILKLTPFKNRRHKDNPLLVGGNYDMFFVDVLLAPGEDILVSMSGQVWHRYTRSHSGMYYIPVVIIGPENTAP